MSGSPPSSVIAEHARGAASTASGAVRVELTDDEVPAWLGVLNDARLALGDRLESPRTPTTGAISIPTTRRRRDVAAYAWLT